MKKILLFILLAGAALKGHALGADTVRAAATGGCWSIVHKLGAGERIELLERRYRLPAGTLARAYPALRDASGNGEQIEIPIGAYNRITDMPWSLDTARPLYYKVQPWEKLADISRCARISRNDLMLFNSLSGEPAPGAYICVGWVRHDRRLMASSALPASGTPVLPPAAQRVPIPRAPLPEPVLPLPDTFGINPPRPAVQTMGDLWNEQTQGGQNVNTEKGSVAFYALNSKAPGAAAYAFHNSAPRGGIIRVRNLNNGRSIYVKVLGPLPDTKQYAGAILGITMAAKRALGVQEERAFCELSYAGY